MKLGLVKTHNKLLHADTYCYVRFCVCRYAPFSHKNALRSMCRVSKTFCFKMKKLIITLISVFVLISILLFRPIEYEKIDSPDSRYYLIIYYRLFNSIVPIMPGGSGDKPGFATMYSSDGHNLGTLPVSMLSLATEIKWEKYKASIKLIGCSSFTTT